MSPPDQPLHLNRNRRLLKTAHFVACVSIPVAWLAPFAPSPFGIVCAVVGLTIFTCGILLNGYAAFTKEMKSPTELGFKRNRDAIAYSNSAAGMDARYIGLGFIALISAFVNGFGFIGHASNGGALLAFGSFALLGALARLTRHWPTNGDEIKT